MKIVNYSYKGQRPQLGIVEEDTVSRISFEIGMLELIRRGVLPTKTSERHPLSDITFKAPLMPGKIVAVGRNYADHAAELGNAASGELPVLFAKFPSSVIGDGEAIQWDSADTTQVDWEGELAVIISKRARHIDEADAMNYVFGYTVVNDVTARDFQASEEQWIRAKSMDTFCPMGPCVVTRDEISDPHDLTITTKVNGEAMQSASTALMIHKIPALIAHISHFLTLNAGDVILTGTPAGVGKGMNPPRFLADGDTVSVTIDGIGEISNPCRAIDS
ncbi:MAG: FAA hydrolase family protein [Anaerolineaceae bacterium]|nr:MAG: FAA hydrolase family protein [Anaerolineaceae bacterium]